MIIFCFMKLFCLKNIGQSIASKYANIRRNLQKIVVAGATDLSLRELSQYEMLVDWFAKSSPIRPKDMFNLNFSSAATICGIVMTYMLVLVQFKVEECD